MSDSGRLASSNLNVAIQILNKLRSSMEAFSDIWILLLNVWLWRRTSVNRLVPIVGIGMFVILFNQLYPYFSDWNYTLFMVFMHLKISWFIAVGVWAHKEHQRHVESSDGVLRPTP